MRGSKPQQPADLLLSVGYDEPPCCMYFCVSCFNIDYLPARVFEFDVYGREFF